jgi:hypothetical protein
MIWSGEKKKKKNEGSGRDLWFIFKRMGEHAKSRIQICSQRVQQIFSRFSKEISRSLHIPSCPIIVLLQCSLDEEAREGGLGAAAKLVHNGGDAHWSSHIPLKQRRCDARMSPCLLLSAKLNLYICWSGKAATAASRAHHVQARHTGQPTLPL